MAAKVDRHRVLYRKSSSRTMLFEATIKVPVDGIGDGDTPVPAARDTTRVMLNVAAAKDWKLQKWRTAVLDACKGMEEELLKHLGWDSVSKVQELNSEAKRGLVERLDEAQRDFARVAVDLAEELWGKTPGKRRKPKPYRDQRYRIRKLRNM